MNEDLQKLEQQLRSFLGPEAQEILNILTSPMDQDSKYRVELPEQNLIDMPIDTIASYVARSSNAYTRISRFAGIARAEQKLAKGSFERKYKQSRHGRNEAERDANAMTEAEQEHLAMTLADAIAELAESFENAARIASESSRKLLDKAHYIRQANDREEKGYYVESDFDM